MSATSCCEGDICRDWHASRLTELIRPHSPPLCCTAGCLTCPVHLLFHMMYRLCMRCFHRAARSSDTCLLVVQISSFMPRDEAYAALLDGRKRQIPLETLFIHGLEDQLVPLERGKELMSSFSAAGILVHHGAHFVPTCSGQIKQSVVKFLEDATEQET